MNSPSTLRTVFFGTPEFASTILDALIADGEKIVGVVTTPPKQQGRGLRTKRSHVHETAEKHGISVLTPLKLRDPEFQNSLRALHADVFCVVAYRILPREVFTMPTKGSFNIHASLLPKYRGAAPINWAIIRGEKETGITTFLLDDNVDTGGILLKSSLPIFPNETAGELHDRLMHLGARLALETLRGLSDGALRPMPQTNESATTAPKIFPKDCIIDFNRPVEEVHNFVRGLSPYPGAVAVLGETRLKILRARIAEDVSHEIPSGVFRYSEDGKRLFAGTATTAIEILELQREGRAVLQTPEFLRGARSLFAPIIG